MRFAGHKPSRFEEFAAEHSAGLINLAEAELRDRLAVGERDRGYLRG